MTRVVHNVEVMDRVQLMALKLQVEQRLAELKNRLDSPAAALARKSKRQPEWLTKATRDRRAQGLLLTQIAARLGLLKQQERAVNREQLSKPVHSKHLRFLHGFFRAAKRNLSSAEFEALIEIAHDYEDSGTAEAFECSQCAHLGTA